MSRAVGGIMTNDITNNVPDSKIHGATWGPSGSCRPQMGPILAPRTLLSGVKDNGKIDPLAFVLGPVL